LHFVTIGGTRNGRSWDGADRRGRGFSLSFRSANWHVSIADLIDFLAEDRTPFDRDVHRNRLRMHALHVARHELFCEAETDHRLYKRADTRRRPRLQRLPHRAIGWCRRGFDAAFQREPDGGAVWTNLYD